MEEPIKTITVAQAKDKLAEGNAVFIDIRDPDSYAAAHIPGARCLQHGGWILRLGIMAPTGFPQGRPSPSLPN